MATLLFRRRCAPVSVAAAALAVGLVAGDLAAGSLGRHAAGAWSAAGGAAALGGLSLAAFLWIRSARIPGHRDPECADGHPGWDVVVLVVFFGCGLARGWRCGAEADGQLAAGREVEGLVWIDGRWRSGGEGVGEIAIDRLRAPGMVAVQDWSPALRARLDGIDSGSGRLRQGDAGRIRGWAHLAAPRGPRGPGGYDGLAQTRARRHAGTAWPVLLYATHEAHGGGDRTRWGPLRLAGAGRARGRGLLRDVGRLRTDLRGWIERTVGGEAGRFCGSFLLGRARGPAAASGWSETLWRCGCGHILAVSGLHVGLLAGLMALVLAATGLAPRARWWLLAFALTGYGLLVGGRVSVIRAVSAGVLWAAMRASGRRPSPGVLWLLACCGSLWSSPAGWRLVGWQLSYLISASLIGVTAGRRPGRRWPRAGAALLAAQATAWPLVLAHNGWASPFFLLSNGLLVPLCGLVLSVLLTGLLLAWLPGFPGDLATETVRWTVYGFGGLARGCAWLCDRWVIGTDVAPAEGLVAAVGVTAICALGRPGRGLRLALAVIVAGTVTGGALLREGGARIQVADVGQGECWVLDAAGECCVVDVGPRPGTAGRSRRALACALRRFGRTRIDRLFLTHADEDHCGGLEELTGSGLRVGTIHHPQGWRPGARWSERLAEVGARRPAALARGDVLCLAGGTVRVLHPPAPHPPRIAPVGTGTAVPADRSDDNLHCLALLFEIDGLRALLCGDVPGHTQEGWGLLPGGIAAQIVSAAHHGSRTSTPAGLLRDCRAQVMVVSAGRGNRFGHPHAEVLERAEAAGMTVFRTDRDGTVLVTRRWGRWQVRDWRGLRRAAP